MKNVMTFSLFIAMTASTAAFGQVTGGTRSSTRPVGPVVRPATPSIAVPNAASSSAALRTATVPGMNAKASLSNSALRQATTSTTAPTSLTSSSLDNDSVALTSEEAASVRADMTNEPALARVNSAHADLLAAVNAPDEKGEQRLDNFISSTVAGFQAGAANKVADVLQSGTAWTTTQVAQGQEVGVTQAFSSGLTQHGICQSVKGACQDAPVICQK